MIRKRLYLCCILLLLFPCLAQVSGQSTFERLYQSAEPLLSVLIDSQGTVLAEVDAQEQLDLLYAAIAVSADEYWYGFEKYNQFHLLVSSRLYETLIEQGRAAKAPYLDDYYAQKLLEWKQACPLTLSPDCTYTPITDTLVKPMPHSSHLTLYSDSEHAAALDNKQIKQQIRSDILSSRTFLFILAACVLILLYAFLCHRIKK